MSEEVGAIPMVILDGETEPGGFHGPCVDLPAERRPMTLWELLEEWHLATFGGEA